MGPASPREQTPVASQKPAAPHSPSGSVIAGTSLQVPIAPGTMQERHSSVQPSLQQMPSTQWPDTQSSSAPQLDALARRRSHDPVGAQ
jgi:hypothetical protein